MCAVPRLVLWCLGHVDLEQYKVNMLFMLVLGSQAEKEIGSRHFAFLCLTTAVRGWHSPARFLMQN